MVSNIGDGWKQTLPQQWPQFFPQTTPGVTPVLPSNLDGASKADVDALRKELEELKKVLAAAKAFDAATGQPHCEMDEKVGLIKALAKMLGVDIGDVFEESPKKPA